MYGSLIIKICPTCGSKKIKKVRRDFQAGFAGQSYSVPSLEFYECPDCGERIYDRGAMRKIEEASPAFRKTRTRKAAGQ